jgi:hypothetical protein
MEEMYETLTREIRSAEEADRPVAQIRVTPDAIQGSVTTAPMTPERARVLGQLLAMPALPPWPAVIRGLGAAPTDEMVVFGSPSNERLLEILIHPDDWRQLLTEVDNLYMLNLSGPVKRIAEVPVSET